MNPIEADTTEPVKKKWTPEPWETRIDHWGGFQIVADGNEIGCLDPTDGLDEPTLFPAEANAERIVACVNGCRNLANPAAIDAVVEALEWIGSQTDLFFAECSQAEEIISRVRAALKAVKEEQP